MGINNDYFSKLGRNIKGLRYAYYETQQDLAFAIGLDSPNAISNYENGTRIPERDLLIKIAKHYKITEDELINGNFANMKRLITSSVINRDIIDKLLPIICSHSALECPEFCQAYDLHTQIYNQVIDNTLFNESSIEKCIHLYESALEKGTTEAAADCLWFLLLFGICLATLTPNLLRCVEANDECQATPKKILNSYLPSFDEEPDEESVAMAKEKTEYIEDNQIEMWKYVYILKNDPTYDDLADFYIALIYKFSLIQNTLSAEMNSAVGDEMLVTYSLLGNAYAKKFITQDEQK